MHRGFPRRYVQPGQDVQVWCSGRWGPRRVRVNQCWVTVRAEDLYTALLKDDADSVRPGAKGTATFNPGRDDTAGWEVHRNAVWRRGRVFLVCPSCSRRCTRLYVPVENRALACRSCWGLTYESRTLLNYKDSLYGRGALARMLGTSQREMAFITTSERRKERDRRSCERWEARSKLFKSLAASNETFQKTKR